MKKVTLIVLLTALGCSAQDKPPIVIRHNKIIYAGEKGPLFLDCTDDPPCPGGRVCGCIKGTYHPRPYFTVDDEEVGTTHFTIGLFGKWKCEPTQHDLRDVKEFTVVCRELQPPTR